jgi:hypothetical protein
MLLCRELSAPSGRRDLAETRLFVFLRGSIWYGACQYRSSHGSRDTDPLQHVAVHTEFLIPLNLLIVLPVVSNAIFLSVGSSPITIGFGSSFQFLSRSFSFRHDGGEAAVGRGRREKKQESTCCRSNCGHDGTGFHAFKHLSVGSTRRGEAVAHEGARNSVKRVHFGAHRSRVSVYASHEALSLRSA